jgi:hypothetical protein
MGIVVLMYGKAAGKTIPGICIGCSEISGEEHRPRRGAEASYSNKLFYVYACFSIRKRSGGV